MPGRGSDHFAPELRARLRARDADAWEALYDHCGSRVRALAGRILPPRLDPEGAAQQTWVRAMHRAGRLDAARDPVPWLLSICVNLCISVIRRDRVRQRFTRRTRAERPIRSFDPEGSSHNREVRRVRESVATLSRPLQHVIYLRYACRMSTAEIAQVLGVREDAARKRLSRAYERLRPQLAETDLETPPHDGNA